MTKTDILLKVAEMYKKGNIHTADKFLQKYISDIENTGQYNLAKNLRKLLSIPQSENKDLDFSNSSINNSDSKLFEFRESEINKSYIILNEENTSLLDEVIKNFKKRKLLIENNVPLENKILLYGPPGTGKTLFSYILAGELNLPILHVYLDGIISSYLGDTGRNIRKVFTEANKSPCILFLDEFDALGKKRDDSNELGELKRVVTVLLQNIDELNSSTILVAATNHDHLLDSAIKRRFTYTLNLDLFDKEAIRKFFELYLKDYMIKNISTLVEISGQISGSSLRNLINRSLRMWILNDKKVNLDNLLLKNVAEFKLQTNKYNIKDKMDRKNLKEIVKILRKNDDKLFTFKYLENITGIPDSTLSNILNSKYDNK